MNRDVLRIGIIVRSHGIKGKVKIQPLTDDVNRFDDLSTVIIEQNGAFIDAKITVNRIETSGVYAYLEGYYTRERADTLKNAYLCVARKDAIPLPDNSWFIDDLVGLAVQANGRRLGTLCQVIRTGGVDVYDVEKENKKHMLFPALKRVVYSVDVEKGIMELDAEALSEVCVDED